MPSPDLDRLKAAMKRAVNKGKWKVGKGSATVYAGVIEEKPGITRYLANVCECSDMDEDEAGPQSRANARFIALAYNQMPALIAEIERLRGELAKAKTLGAVEELERIAKDLQSRERGEWAFTSGPALEARAAELRKDLA